MFENDLLWNLFVRLMIHAFAKMLSKFEILPKILTSFILTKCSQ